MNKNNVYYNVSFDSELERDQNIFLERVEGSTFVKFDIISDIVASKKICYILRAETDGILPNKQIFGFEDTTNFDTLEDIENSPDSLHPKYHLVLIEPIKQYELKLERDRKIDELLNGR